MAVMKFLAFVLGVSSLAAAQNSNTNDDYPYTVTPGSVPDRSVRVGWCGGQYASCPQICGNLYDMNLCDPDQLTYTCICSNGPTPNITQYNQTLPFFECQEWKNQQLTANAMNATRQSEIQSLKCGGKSPEQALAAYSSSIAAAAASTMMPSTTAGMASSMTASATAAATTTGGAAALQLGQDYGTSALLTGLVAVFGFIL